jgi:hypothetical protein
MLARASWRVHDELPLTGLVSRSGGLRGRWNG